MLSGKMLFALVPISKKATIATRATDPSGIQRPVRLRDDQFSSFAYNHGATKR